MELYLTLLMFVLCATVITLWLYDEYDMKHNIPCVINKDFLLIEDNTKVHYATGFVKAKYIRPGSYIQNISAYQPVYDKSTGVVRIVDNSDVAGKPCSVLPITLSDELKETIKNQKGG